jgi:hypothetical protein
MAAVAWYCAVADQQQQRVPAVVEVTQQSVTSLYV